MSRSIVTTLFVLLALGGEATADQAPVRPIATDLSVEDAAARTQLIPIQVDEGWSFASVELVQVARGSRRDATYQSGFHITKTGTALAPLVQVAIDPSVPAGVYAVVVALSAQETKADAGAGRRDLSTLSVNILGPDLAVSPSVDVDITSPWRGADEVDPGPLKLADKTHGRGATHLAIQQDLPAMQDGRPVAGTLEVKVTPTLPPGQPLAATITAKGFPLGTSTATLRLSADNLEHDVTIPVNIVRHRPRGWVFWLFLGGMLLGFAIRVYPKYVLQLDELRGRARSYVERLRGLARVARPEEAKKATAIATGLIAKANGRRTSPLSDALTEADVEIKALDDKLAAQITEGRTAVPARARAAAVHALPEAARGALDRARDGLREIDQALLDGDVVAFDGALERVDAALAEAVAQTATAFGPLRDEAARLEQDTGHAPEGSRADLGGLSSEIRKLDDVDADDTAAALVALDGLARSITRKIQDVARAQASFAEAARLVLPAKPELASKLIRAALIDRTGDVLDDVRAIRAAVFAVNGLILEAAGAGVADQLKAGKHLDVLEQVNAAGKLGGPAVAPAIPPNPVVLPEAAAERAAAVAEVEASTAPRFPRETIQPIDPATKIAAQAIRTIAAAVILAGGAWWAYSDQFIGGLREMLSILGAGFLTDVSFDAAMDAVTKVRKPAAP